MYYEIPAGTSDVNLAKSREILKHTSNTVTIEGKKCRKKRVVSPDVVALLSSLKENIVIDVSYYTSIFQLINFST